MKDCSAKLHAFDVIIQTARTANNEIIEWKTTSAKTRKQRNLCKPQDNIIAVRTWIGKTRRAKPLITSPSIEKMISVKELRNLTEQEKSWICT
ncbi:hypothetical protein PoB_004052000 [Plakobranchus ocellatus]|uniref:Uncharacterized protein n=1 Tax=Plakobranchus ocellatus TaxID=259542 RepID=A0AAV4B374_9GAST|nr:hypothetical protein PoB_004052000 [Plakobranchus ocellatus]